MAKNGNPKVKENVPSVIPSGPSPELLEAMKEFGDTEIGTSTSQVDNIVPLIYVLQPLSPQVAKRNAAYIEGAEPGMFWLRNAPTPLVPGEEGILVQPIKFDKYWAEWRTRESGGGFVGRHEIVRDKNGMEDDFDPRMPDAVPVQDGNDPSRIKSWTLNGNNLVLTRSHVFRVFTDQDGVLPYVMNFKSTEHATSKNLITLINTRCNKKGPAGIFRLTLKERSNPMGTWFGSDVKMERDATVEEFKAGVELWRAFQSGEKVAEVETPSQTIGQETGDEIPF